LKGLREPITSVATLTVVSTTWSRAFSGTLWLVCDELPDFVEPVDLLLDMEVISFAGTVFPRKWYEPPNIVPPPGNKN